MLKNTLLTLTTSLVLAVAASGCATSAWSPATGGSNIGSGKAMVGGPAATPKAAVDRTPPIKVMPLPAAPPAHPTPDPAPRH